MQVIQQNDKKTHFLHPGCIFVSKEPYLVSTVLGSCVSVCVWDPRTGIAGMNHHIHSKPFNKDERSSQYATLAIPYMLKAMVKLGGIKANFRAHIVGGAQSKYMTSYVVGEQNVKVAEKIMKNNFIQIITVDTGGEMGRKVVFDTENGEIAIYKVNKIRESDWHDN